jgi:hypothetical protein
MILLLLLMVLLLAAVAANTIARPREARSLRHVHHAARNNNSLKLPAAMR